MHIWRAILPSLSGQVKISLINILKSRKAALTEFWHTDTILYNSFKEIVRKKARNMMKSEKYQAYIREWLKELNPTDLTKAFRIGAVDAMILDMSGSTSFRVYGGYDYREKLIRECIEEGIIPDR